MENKNAHIPTIDGLHLNKPHSTPCLS